MLTTLIVVLPVVAVLLNLVKDLLKEGPLSKHESKHKRLLIALLACAALVAVTLPIASFIQKSREKKAAEEIARDQQQQQEASLRHKEEELRLREQKAEQERAELEQAEQRQEQDRNAGPSKKDGRIGPDSKQGKHHPFETLGRFFRGEGQYLIGNHPAGFYSVQSAPPPVSKQHTHQAEMSAWMATISSAMSADELMRLGPNVLDNCKRASFANLGLPFKWFFAMRGAYSREYGSNAWQILQKDVPSTAQYWTEPDPEDDTNARVKQYGCRQVQIELTNLQQGAR